MKNDCKNAIRYLVSKTYETYAKYKNSISVLSLPGESWEFENHILNHQDYRNCIQQIPMDLQLLCFEKSFRTYSVSNLLDKNKDNLDNDELFRELNHYVARTLRKKINSVEFPIKMNKRTSGNSKLNFKILMLIFNQIYFHTTFKFY